MLSVIIPARNEPFLNKTIEDILEKSVGEIEVIAVLDGYAPKKTETSKWSTPDYLKDNRVTYLAFPHRKGMRFCVNEGIKASKGDYIMKSDAHCMYQWGFDEALKLDCDDDWVCVPRRNRLDAETWTLENPHRTPFDYCYMDTPFRKEKYMGNPNWFTKNRDKSYKNILIDDNMIYQGSCWFCKKSHFLRMGYFDTENYWGWEQEPQELVCKTWLSGGRVIVNKKIWYAHLRKGSRYGRMYFMNKDRIMAGNRFSADYWVNNRWPGQTRKFEWLIDKFWPVPTWQENWKELKIDDFN